MMLKLSTLLAVLSVAFAADDHNLRAANVAERRAADAKELANAGPVRRWLKHRRTQGNPADNSDGGTDSCFSGFNQVDVWGKGEVRMDELYVGDRVRTADGSYSAVYSFAHMNREAPLEYLRINSKLEISQEHMLYTDNKGLVPARHVEVGDSLLTSEGTTVPVKSINKVNRLGLYAPLTHDGKLVVSGFAASSYVAFPESLNTLLSWSQQSWMQHAALVPVRAICGQAGCQKERYQEGTGYSYPVAFWLWLVTFASGLSTETARWAFVHLFGVPALWLFTHAEAIFAASLGYYAWKKTNLHIKASDVTKEQFLKA